MQLETLHALRSQLESAYESWVDNEDDPRNAPYVQTDRQLLPSTAGIELNSDTLASLLARPVNTYHMQLALVASLYSHVAYHRFGNVNALEEAIYTLVADSTIHPLRIGLKGLGVDSGLLIDLPSERSSRYENRHHKQLMAIAHTHPSIDQIIKPSVISEEADGSYAGDLYVFKALKEEGLRKGPASPLPYAIDRPLSLIVQAARDGTNVGVLCFREGVEIAGEVDNNEMVKRLYRMKRFLAEADTQDEVRLMLDLGGYRSSFVSFDWETFFSGYPIFTERQLDRLTEELIG